MQGSIAAAMVNQTSENRCLRLRVGRTGLKFVRQGPGYFLASVEAGVDGRAGMGVLGAILRTTQTYPALLPFILLTA